MFALVSHLHHLFYCVSYVALAVSSGLFSSLSVLSTFRLYAHFFRCTVVHIFVCPSPKVFASPSLCQVWCP